LFEDTVKDELVAGGVDPDDIHDIELSEGSVIAEVKVSPSAKDKAEIALSKPLEYDG